MLHHNGHRLSQYYVDEIRLLKDDMKCKTLLTFCKILSIRWHYWLPLNQNNNDYFSPVYFRLLIIRVTQVSCLVPSLKKIMIMRNKRALIRRNVLLWTKEFLAINWAISLNETLFYLVEITTRETRHIQQIHIDKPSMQHCPRICIFKTGFPKCML